MAEARSYQGSVELHGSTVAYDVQSMPEADGSALRELTLHRPPYRPTEFLELMRSIAPMPSFSDVNDIKGDMSIILDSSPSSDQTFNRLVRSHSRAFGTSWQIMATQAQTIHDALPYRFAQPYRGLDYGARDLFKAIKSIKHNAVRAQLIKDFRVGIAVALPFEQREDGAIQVPETPFAIVTDESDTETYVKTASLDVDDGVVRSTDYGLSADGLGKVVFNKVGHRFPLWETHHIPNIGVAPQIRWRHEVDGTLTFMHGDIQTADVIVDGQNWQESRSSVVGCMVLAALAPEISNSWKSRQGFYPGAERTQRMGGLQAILLSVVAANRLLQGDFIKHTEDALAA